MKAGATPSLRPLAFLMRDLDRGGDRRSQLRLAGAVAARGFPVDLVLCSPRLIGTGIAPAKVRVVNLRPGALLLARLLPFLADPAAMLPLAHALLTSPRPSPTLAFLPALVGYLRRERPAGIIAAATTLNLEAIWARQRGGTDARVVVCERARLPAKRARSGGWGQRRLLPLVTRYYPMADAIVASSMLGAGDLAASARIDPHSITVVYDTLAGPEIAARAAAPCPHPWFERGAPPVVLGSGPLSEEKDYPTLIRAFALLRAQRDARLLIVARGRGDRRGTAAVRADIKQLVELLGVSGEVQLLEDRADPYPFMARAAVFALSSGREGFGDVLVEAMTCGCPVVSTDCPRGPREILAGGLWGPLVPVGDAAALAAAIARTIDAPPSRANLAMRAADFSLEHAVDAYLRLLAAPGRR